MLMKPEASIEYQTIEGKWEKVGATHDYGGLIGESLTYDTNEEGGPSVAYFQIQDTTGFYKHRLTGFTPIVIKMGGEDVWSGRVVRTPNTRGASEAINIECQGWYEHLKDDPINKAWVIEDPGMWKDARQYLNADLSLWNRGGEVVAEDGMNTIRLTNGTVITAGQYCGIVLDMGVGNTCEELVVTYGIGAGSDASALFRAAVSDGAGTNGLGDFFGAGATYEAQTIQSCTTTTSATSTITFTVPQRYVLLYYYRSAGATYTGDLNIMIQAVRVFADSSYRSGTGSDLHASTVISEALSAKCPLISSYTGLITATTFDIPSFHTGGYMPVADVVKAVNEYHGYQFMLTPNATAVPVFRPVPTMPLYSIGQAEDYSFEDPSLNDVTEVYNRTITPYISTQMQGGEEATSEASIQKWTPAAAQPSNPSFDTNTTGWSATDDMTLSRDTGTFDSTPASAKLTDVDVGGGTFFRCTTGNGSTMQVGKLYRLQFAAKCSTGTRLIFVENVTSTSPIYGWMYDVDFVVKDSYGQNRSPFTVTTSWQTFTVEFVANVAGQIDQLDFFSGSTAGLVDIWFDSFVLLESSGNIVDRRGFTRTAVRQPRSRLSSTAAAQLAQAFLDSHQFAPLSGSATVQGWVRGYSTGELIHVSKLKAGEMILLEDEVDPNTGALGRTGIIKQTSYSHDNEQNNLTIDNDADYIDAVESRIAAFLLQRGYS